MRKDVNPVDRDAAAAELLTRRRARAGILENANAIEVPGRPVSGDAGDDTDADIDGADDEQFEPLSAPLAAPLAAHHRLILERVDAISRTPHERLMVFTPLGSDRLTYASMVFPS
ncbi:hypothetical protein [Caballeronia sp. J97]|uniref:hypothetical protein n=1 Tax=Caballeronia sp. J97 TaxID=2805429 RepID=UPI002AB084E7|nr:hypothetical protein [Caballeronia sp. J97]